MADDTFLIAPLKSGLVKNQSSWLIPNDAFTKLNNAYIHEGRIRKRFGSRLIGDDVMLSRLRIWIGNTSVTGTFNYMVPGVEFGIGQMFSVEDELFTVIVDGTPAEMISTEGATVKTYNTDDGELILETTHLEKAVYFYPAEPVMGIASYEAGTPNHNPAFAFDTQFIYEFTGVNTGWIRSGDAFTGNDIIFKGADHQFFNTCNWLGIELFETALYVTNNNATIGTPGADDDPMYSYNGTSWSEFRPVFNVTAPNTITGFVQTAKIIKVFDGKMLLFATTENVNGVNEYHGNRVRWSIDGSPACPVTIAGTPPLPVTAYKAWLEPNKTWTGTDSIKVEFGGAGWIDAGTAEEIISVEYIRNRIIAYFERSTWELAITGNKLEPFTWRKLNCELGSIATYSSIAFDDTVLTLGSNGVTACNGVVVEKADETLGDDEFNTRDSFYGNERVFGIRDFDIGMAYWTFPSLEYPISLSHFPNKLMLFNYKENSWATADDCITCFGYYEQRLVEDYIPKAVLTGNQQGFVSIIEHDNYKNAAVLQITNIVFGAAGKVRLTVFDHMLKDDDFIKIEDVDGVTNIDGIYKVIFIDEDTLDLAGTTELVGTYTGGGYAARVSKIDIMSKDWNPYVEHGTGVYLAEIEFAVKRTSSGELTIDCYPSSSSLSMLTDGKASGAIMGTGILETSAYSASPLEAYQELLWHPVYFQVGGSSVQIRLFLSDAQMLDEDIALSNMVIEALMLHTSASSFHT